MSMVKTLIRTILGLKEQGIKPPTRTVLEERVAGTQLEIPRHPRVELPTVNSVLQKTPSALHCVQADTPSLEALTLMAEHNIGAVLVLDGNRPIGIFSERDYARISVSVPQSAPSLPSKEVMTPCEFAASLTDSVQKCLSLMADNRLHYLPVQDQSDFVALLSNEDLLGEMVAYLERVFKENDLDKQIVFLRGTYSC